MDNLFKSKRSFEKTAGYNSILLDKDPTQWVRVIIGEFLTEYPTFQNSIIGITWKKQDFNKGYAVGSLTLRDNMNIPLVVNHFKCSPLDIININGVFIPLTTENINELLSNPNPFQGVASAMPKSNLALFGEQRLQLSPSTYTANGSEGSYDIRDAVKVASFIDNISVVDSESINNILQVFQEDPSLYAEFEKNGTAFLLEKIAKKDIASTETEIAHVLRELPIDRQFLYTDEDGNKILKQANSSIDYTWDVNVNDVEGELTPLMNTEKVAKASIKIASDVHTNDRGYFSHNGKQTDPFVVLGSINYDDTFSKIASLRIDGTDESIIIVDDGSWAIKPGYTKIASTLEVTASKPEANDMGIFVIPDTDVSTRPFNVNSIFKVATDTSLMYEVTGFTNLGDFVNYTYVPIEKNAFVYDANKATTYIPKNAVFLKLGQPLRDDISVYKNLDSRMKCAEYGSRNVIEGVSNFQKVAYVCTDEVDEITKINPSIYLIPTDAEYVSTEEANIKTASVNLSNASVTKMDDNEFLIKMAFKDLGYRKFNFDEAHWELLRHGATNEDLEKLGSLRHMETYNLVGSLTPLNSITTIEKIVQENFEKNAANLERLTKSLIKEAAVINDKISVDAILSLGLLKKFNVMEYVQLIPEYEMVMSELAKLLLMVRMGTFQIPEIAVKTAMEALSTVVATLKQVKTLAR